GHETWRLDIFQIYSKLPGCRGSSGGAWPLLSAMNRFGGGCSKFGPIIAKNLRAIRPKAYTRWHLDEMVVSLSGKQMYLWRAVDGEGEVLEILVQPQRDKVAAMRLLRNLLRRQGFVPPVIVTDK